MTDSTHTADKTLADSFNAKPLLDCIPSLPQRQDSLTDQLTDLRAVANKLGMCDAANALSQIFGQIDNIRNGCHCDLEPGMQPDDCVFDDGTLSLCHYAKPGMRKEQCQYWRIVV